MTEDAVEDFLRLMLEETDVKETKGIFTALLTPFDKDGKINEAALRRLVSHNIALGATGFYVGGSTAEAFLLTTDERCEIMRIMKDEAPEKTLIAHIGSIDERVAHTLSQTANGLGYDMISSVAPFYYKFSFGEIRDYYFRLAENSDIPMLVYHFPAFSGVNMGISEMKTFLENDKFAGIKYTSNDFFMLERCKSEFPNKLVYNGFDEMMLSGLAAGADGGIGSTYNFMADKFVKIRNLFSENRIDEAKEIQREVNRIISIILGIGVMQAEKEIINQLGIDFGVCRHPFSSPTEEQKEIIAREIIPFIKEISV